MNRLEITAELLRALGHPMRLAMVELLKDGPWCVCELASNLGLGKSTASKHLSLLREVGVVEMEKKGTQVHYSLATPCVVQLSRCSYEASIRQRMKRLKPPKQSAVGRG